jgi:hypothetical protein
VLRCGRSRIPGPQPPSRQKRSTRPGLVQEDAVTQIEGNGGSRNPERSGTGQSVRRGLPRLERSDIDGRQHVLEIGARGKRRLLSAVGKTSERRTSDVRGRMPTPEGTVGARIMAAIVVGSAEVMSVIVVVTVILIVMSRGRGL